MRRFFLTSDKIDILCLVYSNFYTKNLINYKKNISSQKTYVFRLKISFTLFRKFE